VPISDLEYNVTKEHVDGRVHQPPIVSAILVEIMSVSVECVLANHKEHTIQSTSQIVLLHISAVQVPRVKQLHLHTPESVASYRIKPVAIQSRANGLLFVHPIQLVW
jgi:hypothetical protein